MLLTCIQNIPNSNLCWGTNQINFLWFSSVCPCKCLDNILKSGHDCFFLRPFLFITTAIQPFNGELLTLLKNYKYYPNSMRHTCKMAIQAIQFKINIQNKIFLKPSLPIPSHSVRERSAVQHLKRNQQTQKLKR